MKRKQYFFFLHIYNDRFRNNYKMGRVSNKMKNWGKIKTANEIVSNIYKKKSGKSKKKK
jgi:hypothetical protein